MNRRRFLQAITCTTPLVAGCTGSDESADKQIEDSDGDGVIDSQDYAPNDPDVQEKSDLKSTTRATASTEQTVETTATTAKTTTETTAATIAETTATEATTAEATTTTAETATTDSANRIRVPAEYWGEQSHITAYSSETVDFVVYDDHDLSASEVKAVAALYEYPRGNRIAYAESDAFAVPNEGSAEVAVAVDSASAPRSERIYYSMYLIPGDESWEAVDSERVEFVTETDPFRLHGDGVTISRDPHPDALDSTSTDSFSRESVEGAYDLTFRGRTGGKNWEVSLFAFKSAHLSMVNRSRGRSYSEYVTYELTEGSAGELATLLDEEAQANDFTGKREKVEFIIDFVQSLPYVPDDVSKGYDDYSKFMLETVAEAGGDCEDTSILLASVLEAEPFGYDMVMIAPEGHMAVGIKGSDDLPGYYWEHDGSKYYYIETTGQGWGIGDVPEEYDTARVYQV